MDSWFFLSFLPRRVVSTVAGLEKAKNLAGKVLRLIQIPVKWETFFTETVLICLVRRHLIFM
jgi:hypothetical protein